jgi:hypothetical protein
MDLYISHIIQTINLNFLNLYVLSKQERQYYRKLEFFLIPWGLPEK